MHSVAVLAERAFGNIAVAVRVCWRVLACVPLCGWILALGDLELWRCEVISARSRLSDLPHVLVTRADVARQMALASTLTCAAAALCGWTAALPHHVVPRALRSSTIGLCSEENIDTLSVLKQLRDVKAALDALDSSGAPLLEVMQRYVQRPLNPPIRYVKPHTRYSNRPRQALDFDKLHGPWRGAVAGVWHERG